MLSGKLNAKFYPPAIWKANGQQFTKKTPQ
jgi:hypothetical protein